MNKYCRQNIKSFESLRECAVIGLWCHGMLDLYLSILVCSRIPVFEYFRYDSVDDQYMCSLVLVDPPEDSTPVPKHVRVDNINCIL